jgi:plasmid stability protein
MEEEARDILRNAVNEEDVPVGGLGTEISALFAKVGLDSDVPELRGQKIKPASFES